MMGQTLCMDAFLLAIGVIGVTAVVSVTVVVLTAIRRSTSTRFDDDSYDFRGQ